MDSWKVTAHDKEGNLLASYIFEDMKEALSFHSGMSAKGYESVMERISVK